MASENWQNLTKLERRNGFEKHIAEAMDDIEQSCQKITGWQKVKLLGAIQAAKDGL